MTLEQKLIVALGEMQFNLIVSSHKLEEAQRQIAKHKPKNESDPDEAPVNQS